MEEKKIDVFEDLDIGDEQVTSNECWLELDDMEEGTLEVNQDLDEEKFTSDEAKKAYQDLTLGEEQVTSNECYQEEE